jgi:hypothetical protein
VSKTRDELVAIALAHARSETGNDVDLTLSTLEPDPVYELQPVGRVMRGMPAARRYYEHFFARFRPLVRGVELRNEWVTDEGVGQEYVLTLATPEASSHRQERSGRIASAQRAPARLGLAGGERSGSLERHHVIGILTFGTEALSGERVYASERLLRLMFGPAYELTEPL